MLDSWDELEKRPGMSSLSYLDECVLRLDITMEKPMLVHEGDRLHYLEHDVPDLRLWKNSTSLSGKSVGRFLTSNHVNCSLVEHALFRFTQVYIL